MASEAKEEHTCDTCGEVCKNITELFDHILIIHDKAFDNNENKNDDESEHDESEHDESDHDEHDESDHEKIIVEDNKSEKTIVNDVDHDDDVSDSKEEEYEEGSDSPTSSVIKNRQQIIDNLNKLINTIIEKRSDKNISGNKNDNECKDAKKELSDNDNEDKKQKTKTFHRGIFMETNPMLRKRTYRKIEIIPPYHPSRSVTNSAPLHSQASDLSNIPHLSLIEDKIPTSYYGKYICPVCSKKYSSPYYMGEHYTLSHNGYEEQLLLDDKKHKTSFAGFDVLEIIGMTEIISRKELIILIEKNDSCPICVRDSRLTDNELDEENIFPIKIKCCNNIVCKSCLKSHCSVTNSIKCPVCTVDHTRMDLDYIKIIDFENPDKESWRLWKMKYALKIYDCL
jgi:hypothetical protein